MSKREEELEKRVEQLEDALSTLINMIDSCEYTDWYTFELEEIEDARSVWLQDGELEEEYDT